MEIAKIEFDSDTISIGEDVDGNGKIVEDIHCVNTDLAYIKKINIFVKSDKFKTGMIMYKNIYVSVNKHPLFITYDIDNMEEEL